jgi:hypothetical protein
LLTHGADEVGVRVAEAATMFVLAAVGGALVPAAMAAQRLEAAQGSVHTALQGAAP